MVVVSFVVSAFPFSCSLFSHHQDEARRAGEQAERRKVGIINCGSLRYVTVGICFCRFDHLPIARPLIQLNASLPFLSDRERSREAMEREKVRCSCFESFLLLVGCDVFSLSKFICVSFMVAAPFPFDISRFFNPLTSC